MTAEWMTTPILQGIAMVALGLAAIDAALLLALAIQGHRHGQWLRAIDREEEPDPEEPGEDRHALLEAEVQRLRSDLGRYRQEASALPEAVRETITLYRGELEALRREAEANRAEWMSAVALVGAEARDLGRRPPPRAGAEFQEPIQRILAAMDRLCGECDPSIAHRVTTGVRREVERLQEKVTRLARDLGA